METKTRKTTMIGAALAVAIIALAGAGYAALTQYTASTVNEDNTMDATYLTMTQTGGPVYTANFLNNMYFKSENTAQNTTKYTPIANYAADYNLPGEGESATLALISKDLTLKIVSTNSDATTVDMKVTVTNFNKRANLTYTMVIGKVNPDTSVFTPLGDNAVATVSTTEWSFSDLPLNKDSNNKPIDTEWTVRLFVSGYDNEGVTGFPTSKDAQGQDTPAAQKAKFTFEITAEAGTA